MVAVKILMNDVLQRGVAIAEGDDGHVHVRRLLHRLSVGAGIGDDEKAGLLELLGVVVGEGARREAARDRDRASVLRELEHCALAIRPSRDSDN